MFDGKFSNATFAGLLCVCRDHNLFLMFQEPLKQGLYFPLRLGDTDLNDGNLWRCLEPLIVANSRLQVVCWSVVAALYAICGFIVWSCVAR